MAAVEQHEGAPEEEVQRRDRLTTEALDRAMHDEIADLHKEAMVEVAGKYAAAIVFLGVVGLVLGLCAIFA